MTRFKKRGKEIDFRRSFISVLFLYYCVFFSAYALLFVLMKWFSTYSWVVLVGLSLVSSYLMSKKFFREKITDNCVNDEMHGNITTSKHLE